MKKLLLILMSLVSFMAHAYDFELPAGNYGMQKLQFNILSTVDQTVAVVGGTTGIIPCTVVYNNKTYTVTEIGRYAFSDVGITDYRLPLSLKCIREQAFGWSKAPIIAIPDGVEVIESGAFWCSSVETIIIGSGVKTIGDGAFYRCPVKTLVFRSPNAPTLVSESTGIGNSSTTIIVPQLEEYEGSEIARANNGVMIEPIYFGTHDFVYSGEIPKLEYVVKINSANIPTDMTLKNKDAGQYQQTFWVGLNSLLPSYRFSDFDGYATYPDRGVDVTYKYVINRKPLYITIDNQTKIYGDPNPSKYPYSVEGFVGTENEAELNTPIEPYTSASLVSEVGDYAITCNTDARNYETYVKDGVLSIKKAPISVTAENVEREYGDANPSFSRSYLGFKLGDTEATAFTVPPRISCNATRTSDVGEYPIFVNGGSSRNYEIASYENGTLSVIKATATLTAVNKERLYYEENPQFEFSLSGLKNGDTKSCVTNPPTFRCTANKNSDSGIYLITPENANALNYSFEYVSGQMEIKPRPLSASAESYSRVYGSENPSFEISYRGFVNNEESVVLLEEPTIACAANSTSDVGTYAITLSGGNATNYYFSNYINGTLTVTKADQSIVWNQNLSDIVLYSQVMLEATSDAGLPVTYEMSPNNVATLYSNTGKWYLDCFGSGAVNIRAVQNGDNNHNAAETISKTLIVYGSGGDDPSNPQIFLNIENPGSLSSMIAENRKYQIKNLRLTGHLNGTDINFIREMAGSDSNGSITPGILETLDISGCTIVSGGRSYYKSNRTSDYEVGDYMFFNCKVLTTLRIPENTIAINDCAFADCDRLSVVSIPNTVTTYGVLSFRNDISLLRIPMPEKLATIGDMAFEGCNGLTELNLPASVVSIGDGIIRDCENISQINVETGNLNYASQNGVLYNSSLDELIIFPVKHNNSEYSVSADVVSIAPYAFFNAKGLVALKLPSTVTTIGKDAFIGCVNLARLQVAALTPPLCQNDCFENVSKTRCELQVPFGCRSYYWVAPVWSEFNKIVESNFSGLSNMQYDELKIVVNEMGINIVGYPRGLTIRIFDVNGILLVSEEPIDDVFQWAPRSKGVYIIMIGETVYKIRY